MQILFKLVLKQQSNDILKILQLVMRDAYSNPLSNLWLQKFVLAYRDPKSKEEKILSQIHRSQCGICERHFKPSVFKICK